LNVLPPVSGARAWGAEALAAPMTNTPAAALRLGSAAKSPPLGQRSWGPLRAMALQSPRTAPVDYMREANDGTLAFAMVETVAALACVDTIASTPGIDGLFVGPYDLATALSGGSAQDVHAAQVEQAIDTICA